MLVRQVAMVPEGVDIDLAEITRVAAAQQKQVTRDFSPLWQVNATVDGIAALEGTADRKTILALRSTCPNHPSSSSSPPSTPDRPRPMTRVV